MSSFLDELIDYSLKIFIGLCIFSGVVYVGYKLIGEPDIFSNEFRFPSISNNWTLIECVSQLNNSECSEDGYVIEGFDSSRECMMAGIDKFNDTGFECGLNCKTTDLGRKCIEICNRSGCTK